MSIGSRSLRMSPDSDEFESPEEEGDQSTLVLRTRSLNVNEPSTSRSAATARSFAKKSTSKGPYGPYPARNAPERERRSTRNSTTPATKGKPRKRKQNLPRHLIPQAAVLKEIRKLQNSTDFMIPRLPFGRLVREIIYSNSNEIHMITKTALEALQEATELYCTQVFNDAYCLTLHRGRVTLSKSDMDILRILRLIEV